MAKITIEELSESLKNYLDGLGLTEAQVQDLIDKFEDEKIGDITQLSTEEKGSLVGAINELFQSANNGKELIASAIGEPLNAEDTFQAMSTDINGLLSTFKTNMMNNGITVESSDRFKSLIDKIATMVEEGEGKGIQYAEGTFEDFTEYLTTSGTTVEVPYELNFTPTLIFVKFDYINNSAGTTITNAVISNKGNGQFYMNYGLLFNINNISSNSFSMVFSYGNNSNVTFEGVTWYAIGVGEEDTTLRDSLASILEDKGVDITEEDDMASLITKVDEEFSNSRTVLPKWYTKGAYATFTNLPVGGWDIGSCEYNDDIYAFYDSKAYCLDMDTGIWKTISSMPTTRSGPSATCVGDKIYVVGGYSNNNNECYDPATDTWTTKTSRDGTGTSRNVVYNDIIYFFGNKNAYLPPRCYDPATDTWTVKSGGPTSQSTLDNTVGLINDMIYFIGRYTSDAFMYIYDPKTEAYTTGTATNCSYMYYAGSAVYNNIFYFFCGYGSYSCHAYDPINNTGWAIEAYPSDQSLEHISSVVYKDYIINLGGEYYSSGRSYERTYCIAFIPE